MSFRLKQSLFSEARQLWISNVGIVYINSTSLHRSLLSASSPLYSSLVVASLRLLYTVCELRRMPAEVLCACMWSACAPQYTAVCCNITVPCEYVYVICCCCFRFGAFYVLSLSLSLALAAKKWCMRRVWKASDEREHTPVTEKTLNGLDVSFVWLCLCVSALQFVLIIPKAKENLFVRQKRSQSNFQLLIFTQVECFSKFVGFVCFFCIWIHCY